MIDRLSFTVLILVLIFLLRPKGALIEGTLLRSQPANASGTVSSEANTATEKTAVVPAIGAGVLLKVSVFGVLPNRRRPV